ncbi:MAG: DUF2786 domain-containing protein [Verrucomicrobia bacterium]|nr:DUF2786 domain-containing protein [Verrucomicrobiota bacterium]
MIIYSKKIISFTGQIKQIIKVVLTREVGLKVGRDRFLDFKQRASYPINIVIYNNKTMLGYFDPNFYELGFHECLMNKEQLENVIRHELGHYIAFIVHGETIQAHGPEFRALCHHFGWGEEVYRATTCLEDGEKVFEVEQSPILRKVQKLMALATSNNQHEAESAMIKSQQLLLKHNLDCNFDQNDEKICLKRLLKQNRENGKMRAIGKILETFFVSIVFNRAKDGIYLEILGDLVNVEIAEYVADVLDRELDNMWESAKRQANLKGAIAKNSFFLGLAKGYCNKIEALKRDYNREVRNALIVIEERLCMAKEMAYPHLVSTRRRGNHCATSAALGELMGRKLNINAAVAASKPNRTKELLWKS